MYSFPAATFLRHDIAGAPMPIDIICSSCSRVMRAPDEAAGKQVRCPHCQTVNQVPLTAELLEGNPFPPASGAAGNPYAPPPARPTSDLGQDPVIRMLLPVGRSVWALAAGYMGLFGACPPLAPVAIILGVIAIIHMRRNPKVHGMGRAIFGIVMGIAWMILYATLFLLS